MGYRSAAFRLYGFVVALILAAAPASAQFTPREVSNPAMGENYHVEASAGFWSPSPSMEISSEALGIPGSTIDFEKDLGLSSQRFGELHLVLRPARKHKLRFQYIPIDYTQSATLDRTLVFNGQSYRVGLPVNSELNWKAYRFSYEYDFLTRDRWFAGFLLDMKYTAVEAHLQSPVTDEFAQAKAPVPALGGIGRYYFLPNVSLTGELTMFKIPDSVSETYKAHYTDFDLYGTINFIEQVGAQIGYRSFDVGYLAKKDTGSFTLKGMYFGIVARY